MRLLLPLFLLLLVISSCVTEKACRRKFPPETIVSRDSTTSITITLRDTVFYPPVDCLQVTMADPCPDLPDTTFKSATGTISTTIGRRSGRLSVQSVSAPEPVQATLENRRERTRVKETKTEKLFCELTWWEKTWIFLGKVFVFILFVVLVFYIVRKFIKRPL